jgi:hypothetical protein
MPLLAPGSSSSSSLGVTGVRAVAADDEPGLVNTANETANM